MAGEAKTTEFLLSTATIMIGAPALVMQLNPAAHSIGLVKNVQATVDMAFTELTQGVQNIAIMSINTKADTKISAEVYEFTSQNLLYGSAQDGTATLATTSVALSLSADAVGTSPTTFVLGAGQGVSVPAGSYFVLQDTLITDRVHVCKVLSVATDTITVAAEWALGATALFPKLTTKVYLVNAIAIGATPTQPMFGCKIVGLLPSGQPMTLIFPKVKITKGISLGFNTNGFANMPFEMTPYALVSTDPFYDEFGNQKTWKALRS